MEQVFWRQIDPSLVERAEGLLAHWLGVDKVSVTFPFTSVTDPSVGVFVDEDEDDGWEADWNELSSMGLIVAINFSIFHPRGLAITRDPETGESPYLLQVEDDIWEYTEDILEEAKGQLNRIGIYVPGLNDD
ncbi:putative tail tube protein [Escherichia phage JLBYU43]|uniref:Tail tube protein n=1 Tax=Escherichia phage JLBYU43 TaxID=2894751 RepID=A0AAE9CF83_9CAUD|nr:putative tail tube protein [Escherichia phage JLBYU43]